MLHKTKGIVLHTIKYSDTSVITRIYTQAFGLQSYIVKGARSSRSKQKASMLQPFSLLDLVVYKRADKNLQRISEMKSNHIFQSIPFNMVKGSVAMFLVELLNNVIREEEKNELLYGFIEESILQLDTQSKVANNFHLSFMLSLSGYLGFMPTGSYSSQTPYFDLQEGRFIASPPRFNYLQAPFSQYVHELLHERQISIPNNARMELLEQVLIFYRLHIEGFKPLKSHQILHEVLSA